MAAAFCATGGAKADLTVVIGTPSPAEAVDIVVTPATGSAVPAFSSYTSGEVYAGIYNQTVNGVATSGFCIDVAHDVTIGEQFNNYYYASLLNAAAAPAGPMTAAQAVDIEELWAAYYTSAKGSALDAAALQVAIWETLGNGQPTGNGLPGYTVSDGAALGDHPDATTISVFNQAQIYLNALPSLAATADLEAIVSPTGQSYVIAVPEPTTILAGALLALPFGASLLRILRRNRAA